MKKLWVLLFALILVLAACGGKDKSASDSKGKDGEASFDDLFVTIATGGTSGVYYPMGGALATILEDNLGIDASVQATQASVENVNLILSDRAELAFITGDTGFQAYEGSGAFEKEGAKKDLRALASFYPNYLQIIATEDSGIKSFKDLKGKKIAVGAPNSGTELAARVLLEGHGMSYDDITPDYLSFAEAAEQMKNGIIDAAILSSGIPNSAIMDLETTHGVNFLPIEDDAMKYLTEKYSYLKEAKIPAGSYSNKEDIPAISITNALIVSKDLSEEEVYHITKAIYENLDTLKNAHSAAEDIDVKNAPEGLGIPLHPGAEKYYKEEGVIK
ncbi:MAG TPA: C4-dicarboxylate ABC transporter substrate-binding protein [Bacillus bacterium]|uniref:C4-dicarboxylate ABC transporter n=1 Tax=Siminovitchia fordii TaxID=254759 RepID=A0ABQ4KB96_9BACI|nr:TAXI family TRAP transporter solute-binding subunit [Siminovitchia fordii]GIN22398.1 C4-dicarboxylate ABC transporter [Siminovitchia fordii]HBZ11898.1 C4-dicarboxylate ABC transporter substrate-binding protein [Bacillus sp. (in: firmicutes)]